MTPKDAIARSKSRYRGNRPAKPPVNVPIPSNNRAKTIELPPPRDSSLQKAQSNGDVQEKIYGDQSIRPNNQSARGMGTSERRPETRSSAAAHRNMQHSKREPVLPRGEYTSTVQRSEPKGETHVTSDHAHPPAAQRQHGLLRNDGTTHQPHITGAHSIHAREENVFEQRLNSRHQHDYPKRHLKIDPEQQKRNLNATDYAVSTSKWAPSPKKSFTERMADHISKYQSSAKSDSKADLKRLISTPIAVGSGAEAAVPDFDAPISAVNAGERRVIVKSRDFIMSLPVTPSTTSVDIIRAIASQNPGSVDISTSVLLESFKQVGLERPIRRYEHIRDVLNSWDSDTQNTLVVESSPTGGIDDDLDVAKVPKVQPEETSVYLYYSQKPGHWDKRWVTLRSDGQVVVKKNSGETSNICHLSDFDIYVPTPRQVAKKIKPPKKVCFAVKSQQKSSMFLSTANFVHFFSTGDKKLATVWYKAVQEWRSWYLVNVMGEGQGPRKDLVNGRSRDRALSETVGSKPVGSYNRPSTAAESTVRQPGLVPYHSVQKQIQPSSLSPHVGTIDQPTLVNTSLEGNSTSSGTKPSRNRTAPPVSFPKKLTEDVAKGAATGPVHGLLRDQENSVKANNPQPFVQSGLLGKTYSQRQRPQNDRERNPASTLGSVPMKNAPILGADAGGLKRSSSQRQKPKPLIDLTPVYQEPPQHSRKGKGIVPEQIPAGGLIDIATSPEVAIPIPPTKAWR